MEKKRRPTKPKLTIRLSYQEWNAAPDRADFILNVAGAWARAGRDPLRIYDGRGAGAELTREALEERLERRKHGLARWFQLKSSLKNSGDGMGFLFHNVTRDYWERWMAPGGGETVGVVADIPLEKLSGSGSYALGELLKWMRGMCPPGRRTAGKAWLDSDGYLGPDGVLAARQALRRAERGPADSRPALDGDWLELMPEDRLRAHVERYGGQARFNGLCRACGLVPEQWEGGWVLRMTRPLEDTPEFYDDLRRAGRLLFEAAPPIDKKENAT